MKISKTRLVLNIIALICIIAAGYYFRNEIQMTWRNTLSRIRPCRSPITYSINTYDSQFGFTKANIQSSIQRAEKIWESSIDKQLFEYKADGTGDLKINFIYDYRQKATDSMEKIGVALNSDRSSYDALKAKYDTLLANYNSEKSQITILTNTYNTSKSAYEKQIKYWNNRGGAPREEYAKIERDRVDLNKQTEEINRHVNTVNSLVDTIKQVEQVLNDLVETLNLKVEKYNTIGDSTGRQFNEGEYVQDINGTRINIYQFQDEGQLIRVLAHEVGHSIGLEHIDNPKAIMYYLNEGVNEKPTPDDVQALRNRCGIK